jgi:CRP-like cAMP-binding protein
VSDPKSYTQTRPSRLAAVRPHSATPAPVEEPPTFSLLDLDPDFGREIPTSQLALARRAIPATVVELPEGPWDAGAWAAGEPGLVCAVVLDGLVMRRLALGGHGLPELLGPGDVLNPPSGERLAVGPRVDFSVLEPTRLALLRADFLPAAARWPTLLFELRRRVTAQHDRLATHGAICQMPRVELRVLALLWHLAERWGRVTPSGVVVPLALSHRVLGQLIGARRPTVSSAISELARRDELKSHLRRARARHVEVATDSDWLRALGRSLR